MNDVPLVSQTITQTIVPPSSLTLRLRREEPKTIQNQLKSLIQTAKWACERLPLQYRHDVFETICNWETEFFQNYQIDSTLDFERLKAAYAICIFCFNKVEVVMLKMAESPEEKITWLKIWKELNAILASVLPSDRNVKEFVETWKQREEQKKYLVLSLKVKAFFQKMEKDLFSHANQFNETLMENFENLKSELLIIDGERQLSIKEMYARLDSLNEQVNHLFQQFDESLKEVKVVERIMHAQEISLEGNLDRAEKLLDKV